MSALDIIDLHGVSNRNLVPEVVEPLFRGRVGRRLIEVLTLQVI
jgi:hypothetical protein